jgi:hypothetical protein
VGCYRWATSRLGQARSRHGERRSRRPCVPEQGRPPQARETASREQTAFEGTGQGQPLQHGHDHSSAFTQAGRLSEGPPARRVVQARQGEHLGYDFGLAL